MKRLKFSVCWLLLFSFEVNASIALACETTDRTFRMDLTQFNDGDGIWTIFSDFQIVFNNKPIILGPISWFKLNEHDVTFTNFSYSGRRAHFFARKIDGSDFFKVETGFIDANEQTLDLKNIEIECLGG